MIKKTLNLSFSVLCMVVLLTTQQAAAFTTNDFYCVEQGGVCFYDPNDCSPDDTDGAEVVLTGSSNEAQVWNFFAEKELTPEQIAGIMGNMSQESGFDPENIQNPAGRTKDPSSLSAGWGLIQWTPGSKVIGLAEKAGLKDKKIYELSTQLELVWQHMNNNPVVTQPFSLEDFKKVSGSGPEGAVAATNYWEEKIEGAGIKAMANRHAAAKAALKKYGDGSSTELSGSSSGGSKSEGGCACDYSQGGGDTSGLAQVVKKLADENGGQTAISVSTFDGKISADAGGDTQMPTRSTYKIYTAYATLRAIEDGKISWSTKIWGSKSVEAAMEEMIVKSNNDAATALRTSTKIGTPDEVTKMLQDDIGLSKKTIMGAGGASNSNSQSTANDFNKFLLLLHNQKLFGVTNDAYYEKLLGYMKRATTDGGSARDGIAAGVPKSIEVADKAGWAGAGEDQASNDVGIVYRKEKPYMISILTDAPNKWDGVAKISKDVYASLSGSSQDTSAQEMASEDDVESAGVNCDDPTTNATGDLATTVKAYAWPDYHPPGFLERKPAYADAVTKAKKTGSYVGGSVGGVAGIDCGGFVTRAMIDSGYEPNYNSKGKGGATGSPTNPGTQWGWLEKNWEKINPETTKDMRLGDVAINSQHTYMYVGDKIKDFNSVVASASYAPTGVGGRSPMAGHEAAASDKFTWYRKK